MSGFIEWLFASVAFYRASQDAGMWMINNDAMRDYMESYLISKNKM